MSHCVKLSLQRVFWLFYTIFIGPINQQQSSFSWIFFFFPFWILNASEAHKPKLGFSPSLWKLQSICLILTTFKYRNTKHEHSASCILKGVPFCWQGYLQIGLYTCNLLIAIREKLQTKENQDKLETSQGESDKRLIRQCKSEGDRKEGVQMGSFEWEFWEVLLERVGWFWDIPLCVRYRNRVRKIFLRFLCLPNINSIC